MLEFFTLMPMNADRGRRDWRQMASDRKHLPAKYYLFHTDRPMTGREEHVALLNPVTDHGLSSDRSGPES